MDSSQKGKAGPGERDRPGAEEQADQEHLLTRRDALIRAGWSAPLIVAAVGSTGAVSPGWHIDEHLDADGSGHCDDSSHSDVHADIPHGDQHGDVNVPQLPHGDGHWDTPHVDTYSDGDYHCDTYYDSHYDAHGDQQG